MFSRSTRARTAHSARAPRAKHDGTNHRLVRTASRRRSTLIVGPDMSIAPSRELPRDAIARTALSSMFRHGSAGAPGRHGPLLRDGVPLRVPGRRRRRVRRRWRRPGSPASLRPVRPRALLARPRTARPVRWPARGPRRARRRPAGRRARCTAATTWPGPSRGAHTEPGSHHRGAPDTEPPLPGRPTRPFTGRGVTTGVTPRRRPRPRTGRRLGDGLPRWWRGRAQGR